MKRLIALFISLITSLFQNVDYVQQDRGLNEFAHGSYYVIEEGAEPDYRQIYGGDTHLSSKDTCRQSHNNVASTRRVVQDGTNKVDAAYNGYWFVASEDVDLSDLLTSASPVKISDIAKAPEGAYIINPYPAVCTSDPSFGATSTMKLTIDHHGVTYTIDISGMTRWFCCLNKVKPDATDENGNDVYVHTFNTWDDRNFMAGMILGEANADTTITIRKGDDEISLYDFFKECAYSKQ